MYIGLNNNFFGSTISPQGVGGQILARVDKVILGPRDANGNTDSDFISNGRWASVGCIKYTVLYGSQPIPSDSTSIARPLNPNIVQFPLIGEIVELIPGPSIKLNTDSTAKQLYYRSPINIWNNVHHNALPNAVTLTSQAPQTRPTYLEAANGANTAPVTSPQPVSLGSTFKERSYIKNLQSFEGDLLVQGRWGQSIRFGSTVRGGGAVNPWSSAGMNGNPITIIRNGQGEKVSLDVFSTTIEDINNDDASIYLCSGQVIVLADLANFVNANLLATFTIGSKLEEAQVQRPLTQPISTDTKSPASQSNNELQYAQASSNTVIPSTTPQSKTTVTYNQPATGSSTTATITTQTLNPDGTVNTTVVSTSVDPNQPRDTGLIAAVAILNPNKVTTSESDVPNTSADTQNQPPNAKTQNQIVVEGDLEVIVTPESDLRFSFNIDNTSGDPQLILQDDVPDTESKVVPETTSTEDLHYYPCAVFNQGDPRWGSNSGGGYTLKAAGCCYTSFAMMSTYYKQDNTYTPQWFWDNAKKSTVVYWADMAKAVKLRSSAGVKATTTSTIDTYLQKGPVMFEWDNMNKAKNTQYAGLYTKRHHWMLIVGKGKDGTYTIQDPNGGKVLKNQTQAQIEAGLIRISYIT